MDIKNTTTINNIAGFYYNTTNIFGIILGWSQQGGDFSNENYMNNFMNYFGSLYAATGYAQVPII
jgi:hypothetical protein